jgi:hypothetical protein
MGDNFFGDAGADAREERGGHLGADELAKAGVDGGEERLFFRKVRAASGAGGEMGAQFRLRLGAGDGGFD